MSSLKKTVPMTITISLGVISAIAIYYFLNDTFISEKFAQGKNLDAGQTQLIGIFRWLIILGDILFFGILTLYIWKKDSDQGVIKTVSTWSEQIPINFILVGAVAVLLVVFFVNIFSIIADANWIYGDDQQFWKTTLSGKRIPPPMGVHSMRFFPLAFQEFNLFIGLGNVPYVYYIWQAIKYTIMTVALFHCFSLVFSIAQCTIDRKLKLAIQSLLVAAFLCTPSLDKIFAHIIYPESTQILLLTLFTLFYLKAVQSDKLSHYGVAVLFGALSMYFKEPTFGALSLVVVTPLLFSFSKLTKNRRIFSILMIGAGILFVTLFVILILVPRGAIDAGGYGSGKGAISVKSFLNTVAFQNMGVILILATVAIFLRLGQTILAKVKKRNLEGEIFIFDGFLYAGVVYFMVYWVLQFTATYYFAPAYLFIFVGLAYYFAKFLISKNIHKNVAPLLLLFVLFYIVPFSLYATYSQKNIRQNRKEFMPSLEENIVPIIDESQLIIVVPHESAFPSDFDRMALFHAHYSNVLEGLIFLTGEEELPLLVYDPYSIAETTGVKKYIKEDNVIHSLEELDEEGHLFFLMSPATLQKIPPELENRFSFEDEIKGSSVKFYRDNP